MNRYLIVTYKDAQLEKVRREYPDLLEMVTPAIRADIFYNQVVYFFLFFVFCFFVFCFVIGFLNCLIF